MYNCLFLGSKIVRLAEVDSTNVNAAALIKTSTKIITHETIIYTDNQTNGKGQRGSTWETTPNKNLTVSLVLKTNLLVNEQFLLSKICALGILDFLTDLGIKNTHIKWPNDIYVDNKKIAGMLLENTLKNSKIEFCVAGIGININQTVFNEHLQQATSLQLITNKSYNLTSILNQLLFFIEKRYLQLKAGKIQQINNNYLNHLLGYNTERTYLINNQKVLGVISSVAPSGKLQLIHENNLHEYDMKEIGFVF